MTKPRREIQFFYRHLEPQFSSSQIIVCNIWTSNFSHIFSNIHVIYKGNFTLKGPTASKSVLLFFIFYDVTVLSTITPFYCSYDVFDLIIKKSNPFYTKIKVLTENYRENRMIVRHIKINKMRKHIQKVTSFSEFLSIY